MINFKHLKKSFQFAFKGLKMVFRHEQNFRIHLLIALVVVFAGLFFGVKIWEWSLLVLMIAGVFTLELLNTVFERVVDLFKPRLNTYVEEIKDLMSAVVLVAAITSLIIGALIFIPYLIAWVN